MPINGTEPRANCVQGPGRSDDEPLVFFAVSITFAAIYGYFGILLGSGAIQNLVMSGAFAVAGVAEALPADRRRVAGGLRVLAIGTLLALVILSLVAPDVLGI